MRIAHLVPALTRGGGERVVVTLANRGVTDGHDVTVIAASPVKDGIAGDLDPAVDLIYVTNAQGRLSRYSKGLSWLGRNWTLLTSMDVVHCHLTWAAGLGTLIYKLRRRGRDRTPAIVETYHAVGLQVPYVHDKLHKWMASHRDALALMAEDKSWSAFVAEHPCIASAVIPNGVQMQDDFELSSADERGAARASLGLPDGGTLLVGTVGRLATERLPWIYPGIFAGIARELGPDVHFVIGGDGPELERVEQAIANAGLQGRVHMPGLVREPFQLYPLLDLYVTLNVGAVTGVAALEAAASGVPVVAVQLLDGHELGPDDWIWSSTDPDEVASEAVKLLRDSSALEATARRQQAHVHAHHSVDAMAKAYEHLYEAAIRSARRANRR